MYNIEKNDGNLQYIPKTPKKPPIPLSTSNSLTPFWPRGKSGVSFHHMYKQQSANVMIIRAKRICKD